MGRYRRLLENTGLMFLGSFGSKIISFIMLPFYTMWLSVEDYGTMDIITAYSTILLTCISLNIAESVFVAPSQKDFKDKSAYFTSGICFSFLCAIALLFIFIVVNVFFSSVHNSFFENILYICLLTLSTLYTSLFQQFCKAIDRIKVFASTGVIQTVLTASLGFALIPTYKLEGFIYSTLIANVITATYVFFAAGLGKYISFERISKSHLMEMLKYSTPLIPNSIMWLIVSYLNRPLMENNLGMYAIGIYALANRFPSLINTVFNNFSNSWQISVLEQYGKEGFERFYNVVTVGVSAGIVLLVATFSLCSEFLVKLLLDASYFDAIKYIPILCSSCVFISLESIYGAIFSAKKKSKYYFYSSIWAAVSAILFNYLLIPRFGIDGACWACVISYLVGAITRYLYAKQFVVFKYQYTIIFNSIFLLIVVYSISYLHNYIFAAIIYCMLLSLQILLVRKFDLVTLIRNRR